MELLARLLLGPPRGCSMWPGAPGTYAAPLARRGYRVHVVDPVPLHVEHARQVRIHFAALPACQRRTSMRAINALHAEMVVLSRLVPAFTRSAGETTQLGLPAGTRRPNGPGVGQRHAWLCCRITQARRHWAAASGVRARG